MKRMSWYERAFAWGAFLYLMFQVSRIWIDYSQYEFVWESWF